MTKNTSQAPLSYPKTAIILAGGLGTRLRKVSGDQQKVIMPVLNKPFIHYVVRALEKQHITDLIMCVGYGGKQVEALLTQPAYAHLKIQFSYDDIPDSKKTIGTAAAVCKATQLTTSSLFWLINGDTLTPFNGAEMYAVKQSSGLPACIAICKNVDSAWTANVHYKNGNLHTYNKRQTSLDMEHIDAGVGLFERHIFDNIDSEHLFQLYETLSQAGKLGGYLIEKRFYEINTPSGLEETNQFLQSTANTIFNLD